MVATRPAITNAVSHSGKAIGGGRMKARLLDLFHDRGDVKRLIERRAVNILIVPTFKKAID